MIPTEPVKVLCVDDEVGILRVMERTLSDHFSVMTAKSAAEGLVILKDHADTAVIVSDLKMDGMDGMEFLIQSRTIAAEAMRILVTAHADFDVLSHAINEGHVYKYLSKPFEIDELFISVKRAAEHHLHKKAYEATHQEWLKSQEKLAQAEKLSMLGQLLSAVSHELGNPIANIRQATALLQSEWKDFSTFFSKWNSASTEAEKMHLMTDIGVLAKGSTDIERIFQTMQNASSLVSDIIQDLRGFSRLDDAVWTTVDLHQVIERAINLIRTKYKYMIRFHKQLDRVPFINGLPGPLTQVVLNLLSNAAQAIQEDGDIWIRTTCDNGEVKISIRDNGRGISEEHLPRIFESGFTTKDESEGTGLGLTISNGIIQKHGGSIDVWSIAGQGSEFVIHLPIPQTT